MKEKPDNISQEDWDSVDVPDMGDVPVSSMFRTTATSAQGIADEVVRRRGLQKEPTKERITIRLSADVLTAFRATGKGWQTRMDAAMKDWLKTHSITG